MKKRSTALLLLIFLGVFGAHRFYLKYSFFDCVSTFLLVIVGIISTIIFPVAGMCILLLCLLIYTIEFFRLLFMSKDKFDLRFNTPKSQKKTKYTPFGERVSMRSARCMSCGTRMEPSDTVCPKCGSPRSNPEPKVSRSTNNDADKYQQLKSIKELLDEGVLSQEEFEIEKQKIMDKDK